jgi:ABC-type antimicrobial peptide transport system permease subunit
MIRNYFKIAFRHILNNKGFSAINILGLSIGICSAMVIFMIVYYELSYDRFIPDDENVYRVVLDAKFNGSEGHSAGVPAPLGAAIAQEVTGVDKVIPLFQFHGDVTATITDKDNSAKPTIFKNQDNVIFTNADYFSLLPYQWLVGSVTSALKDPFAVVLTENKAKKYFPELALNEIVGKHITYNDDLLVTVSGIVKDLEEQTTFKALEFISLPTISETSLQQNFMMTVWDDWMTYSQLYIKLLPETNPVKTEAQLKALLSKYNTKVNRDESNTMSFYLQPLSDVHFNHMYPGVGQRIANKSTLYGLLAISGFLLLLGCINFINLTTAKASQRAKEIGIRKTMGSSKNQLVFQFLGETFLITTIASIIAFAFIPVLLNIFSEFTPPGLYFNPFHQYYLFVFILVLIVLVSFLSGLYPAMILSGYKPVAVLKSNSAIVGKSRDIWVRRSLIVSQFVIAQFFIIVTIMVSKQINYSLNADLGFNKDAIITFNTPRDTIASHKQQLLNSIKAIPGVELAATGFLSPADKGVAFTNITYPAKPDIKGNIQIRWGDYNYINVYKLKLLAGRNITSTDNNKEFIINNTYAKLLGFNKPEEAIGQELYFNDQNMPIVGVMQDFHDQSMKASISPLVFFGGDQGSTFHIRLKSGKAGAISWQRPIGVIQKAFKETYPEEEFDYAFFDEKIASMYETEIRTASLLKWSTGLTIFISCLGLLGLVIFTINSRIREIGIRKILGASVTQIVATLSTDFMRLVIIAFFIAAPLAWLVSYNWLQDYAYRTPMSWWVFALSGFAMLLLALITLSVQSIKAAIANPVKSLRTE